VYLGLGLLRGLVYLGLGLTRVFASIVIDMTVLQFCTGLTALKSATNYSVHVGSARMSFIEVCTMHHNTVRPYQSHPTI
jgi:hypothetical protein